MRDIFYKRKITTTKTNNSIEFVIMTSFLHLAHSLDHFFGKSVRNEETASQITNSKFDRNIELSFTSTLNSAAHRWLNILLIPSLNIYNIHKLRQRSSSRRASSASSSACRGRSRCATSRPTSGVSKVYF